MTSKVGNPGALVKSPSGPAARWRGADQVRVVRQFARRYDLGPQPLLKFLTELVADFVVRDDIEHLLVRYGRLDPAFVAALDARRLRLPVVIVENDEIREISA